MPTTTIKKPGPTISETPLPKVSPDWCWSDDPDMDVHATKDRGWFAKYTPFKSEAWDSVTRQKLDVIGIGNVTLIPVPDPNNPDWVYGESIVLKDVLHIPTLESNVFCQYKIEGRKMEMVEDDDAYPAGYLRDSNDPDPDSKVAFFKDGPYTGHHVLELRVPPTGYQLADVLPHNQRFYRTLAWHEPERLRWEATLGVFSQPL